MVTTRLGGGSVPSPSSPPEAGPADAVGPASAAEATTTATIVPVVDTAPRHRRDGLIALARDLRSSRSGGERCADGIHSGAQATHPLLGVRQLCGEAERHMETVADPDEREDPPVRL